MTVEREQQCSSSYRSRVDCADPKQICARIKTPASMPASLNEAAKADRQDTTTLRTFMSPKRKSDLGNN
jgi:hypothetical protein